jgi:hypothetical protein
MKIDTSSYPKSWPKLFIIFLLRYQGNSQYEQSPLTPFRLYCYGSYFGAGRQSYNAFKEEIVNLGSTELYFIERRRGAPEKGVDVKIATDMLVHTFNEILRSRSGRLHSIAVLVSGDADFAPAVKAVKDLGRKIYVLFYIYALSEKLRESSDGVIELTAEDVVLPDLASIMISNFSNELLASINEVMKRVERDETFKPMSRVEQIKTIISDIRESIESIDWINLYNQLKRLHKYLISHYFDYKNVISMKVYSTLTSRLEFYIKIIEKADIKR